VITRTELGCGSGVVGLTAAALLAHSSTCSINSGRDNNAKDSRDRNNPGDSCCNNNCSNISEECAAQNSTSGKVILTDLQVYLPAIAGSFVRTALYVLHV
jgi:hypothetical protein